MSAKVKVTELVKSADVQDARSSNDTIKLWENYREQAVLWRAIALIQVPVALIALVFALVMWVNRTTVLNVPSKPLPGMYPVQEIPDSEFVDAANNFVNLVATYQPRIAERQFKRAQELTVNPLYDRFDRDFLITELRTIETTSRAQVFYPDPTQTSVKRAGPEVVVTLVGDRIKAVAGRQVDPIETRFVISLITVPRNDLNPYGIVVRDMNYENTKPDFDAGGR